MFDNVDLWQSIFTFCSEEERRDFILTGFKNLIQNQFARLTKYCDVDQKKAIYAICFSTSHCLIEGQPGHGKTHVVTVAKQMLAWLGIQSQSSAFTGNAAINCDGFTLHRLFPLFKLQNHWNVDSQSTSLRNLKFKTPDYQVLFIDEISMVDPIYVNMIEFLLKKYKIRICAVGDFRQLAPVSLLSKKKYFFQSSIMKKCTYFQLKHSHRQSDLAFISIINSIGNNDYNTKVWDFFTKRHQAYEMLTLEEKESITHLFYDNKRVHDFNTECFDKLPGKIVNVNPEIQGIFQEFISNRKPRKRCKLTNEETKKILELNRVAIVQLKIGMNFIFTRNMFNFFAAKNREEYEKGINGIKIDLANGTRGIIVDILHDAVLIQTKFHQFYFPLSSYCVYFDSNHISRKFMYVKFFPFTLAYGMTIHKSQGLTLDRAVLFLRGLNEPQLAYVAISRVKTVDGVFIGDFGLPKKDMDETLLDFYDHPAKYRESNKRILQK